MVAERGDGSSQQASLASVIDTRLLGKPPILAGAEAEYNDWAYIIKSYLSCSAQEFTEILGMVEALDEKRCFRATVDGNVFCRSQETFDVLTSYLDSDDEGEGTSCCAAG